MKYLPIFINLKRKKILVFGGGIVAYRKIKILLKFHAIILIISKKICKKLFYYCQNKNVFWISMCYSKKYIDNIFIVIIATNNMTFNQNIFNIVKKYNLLINTVDNKSLCSFIFPSIINRKPILIAISSQGKTPVLIRLIREKIESLLSRNFGKIALLSGKFRNIVKIYNKSFSNRRFFWEQLFNSQFINEVINNNFKNAIQIIYNYMKNNIINKGEVILVGSGPGDSGLLTLRALQILQQADIVIYDYLISRDILNLIRQDAKLICVGKRFGHVSIQQHEINKLLITLSKSGNRVVRLKGGDSFIFGRGAEELIEISNAGINFQIIPGITSSIGISALIGVPLTYRNYSNNVLFVTASTKKNIINSSIYSKKPKTLVIYMCKNKIKYILEQLLLKGFSLNIPIVLIGFGTLLHQQSCFGKLKDIKILSKKINNPILLIIGEVVNLHKYLSWFKIDNIISNRW